MSSLKVDLNLVKKYNIAGPRYTSYPPATRFTEEVGWKEIAAEVARNNENERDLSLYFHIPFCRSLCWYCGCTTVITTQQSRAAIYLQHVKKEVERVARLLNPRRKVTQLHFGGGTPTFLSPDQIRELGRIIHENFTLAGDIEAGVEIDPRRLGRDHLAALREVGFNRASIGVQDFDPKVQQAVHRVQPREQTEMVINCIRSSGFDSINIDLIYGLPFQTAESFGKTLDAVLDLAPERLAIFSYAHVPWLKPAQKILENALPSAEEKLQILKHTVEKLTWNEEYVYIGMDHFARSNDELVIAQRSKTLRRNFQGYSTRGDSDIYAFGMSAISQTSNAYWQNEKELENYYKKLNAGTIPVAKGYFVTEDDRIRREVITRLMCDLALDYSQTSKRLELDFEEYFDRELESLDDLVGDGLICRDDSGLEVTPQGRLFIRNIAMRFDPHLPQPGERRFSKTV